MQQEQSFAVVLEPLEEGGYLVLVPSLPEVVTHGETEEEALEMARDAIRLVLDHRRQQGDTIPEGREPMLRRVNVAVGT